MWLRAADRKWLILIHQFHFSSRTVFSRETCPMGQGQIYFPQYSAHFTVMVHANSIPSPSSQLGYLFKGRATDLFFFFFKSNFPPVCSTLFSKHLLNERLKECKPAPSMGVYFHALPTAFSNVPVLQMMTSNFKVERNSWFNSSSFEPLMDIVD